MKTSLNLGCMGDYKKGWTNLDIDKSNNPDIVHDLSELPLPFPDNTFDYIYASHVLEHLDVDFFKLFKEFHRIMKSNGVLEILVPHFSHLGSAGMDHKRQFNVREFYSFAKPLKLEKIRLNVLSKNYKKQQKRNRCFLLCGKILNYIINISPRFSERVWCYYFGGFPEIEVIYRK